MIRNKEKYQCHECVTERLDIDNEVKEGYLDKVIIELRPEAFVELGRDRWEELSKEKHMCKSPEVQ